MMKKNTNHFAVGAEVQWKWMGRFICGKIKEIHTEPVTQVIKGKSIKRNGSLQIPAYLVESEAGNLALKLQSEIELFEKQKLDSRKPKMFSK